MTRRRRPHKMKNSSEIRRANAIRIMKELHGEKRGNKAAWARDLEMASSLLYRYLKDKGIGDDVARLMEDSGDKPTNWLDQPHDDEGLVSHMKAGVTYLPNTKGVSVRLMAPTLSWQEALDPIAAMKREADMPVVDRTSYPCPVPAGERTFTLRIQGVSMEPDFKDGDLIFVDPSLVPEPRRFVIARIGKSTEAILRRYVFDGGRHFLEASNPAWPERYIEVDASVKLIGTVFFRGEAV